MALTGNYIKYTRTVSETEVDEITIEYPVDLDNKHPDYELRGTTEIRRIPKGIETTEILEDVYLIITGATVQKDGDGYSLGYAYRLFPSTENNNSIDPYFGDYIHSDSQILSLVNGTSINPIEEAYEHLKTLEECVNMSNA